MACIVLFEKLIEPRIDVWFRSRYVQLIPYLQSFINATPYPAKREPISQMKDAWRGICSLSNLLQWELKSAGHSLQTLPHQTACFDVPVAYEGHIEFQSQIPYFWKWISEDERRYTYYHKYINRPAESNMYRIDNGKCTFNSLCFSCQLTIVRNSSKGDAGFSTMNWRIQELSDTFRRMTTPSNKFNEYCMYLDFLEKKYPKQQNTCVRLNSAQYLLYWFLLRR